ncbi:hypothetical protein IKE96_03335 [bacterium]|nr:hypothetical protein [bacterium]
MSKNLKSKDKKDDSRRLAKWIANCNMKKFQLTKKIHQTQRGMYLKKGKDNTELIAKIYIKQITITKDKLQLFEPVYSIDYYDVLYDANKRIEDVTFEELIKQLEAERLFIYDTKAIKKLFNEMFIHCHDKKANGINFIKTETRVFKEGFFLKDGKVIENTLITGIETTKERTRESIQLINELLATRGSAIANDCTLLRFMLWSTFAWCLKEIGKTKGLYGLILTGAPKTSKTGSCLNFSWIYSTPQDREKAVSTTSVFGSRLEESTHPAIIDEAFTLISRDDMQDPMKRCIYNKDTRSTKDKSNTQLTIDYLALGLPIFTMNEYEEFKNYMTRRYHISYYPSSMVVDDKDAEEFENKYSPEYEDSPLKALRYLGRAFADKMIPYIESQSEELFDLEKLTIKILKEIAEEVEEEFNPSVYEIQKSADNFDQDRCSTIRSGLNKLFSSSHYKNPNLNYSTTDFINCANNGEISWLYYRNKQQTFVINKKGFEKEVSQIVGENMDYESILTELNIDMENITYYNEAIYTNRGNTRGFEITSDELITKVFDMYIPTPLNTKTKENS